MEAQVTGHQTLIHLGEEDLYEKVRYGWSRRFDRTIAQALIGPGSFGVEIGWKIWPHLSKDQRFEAMVHEHCHLVVFENYGDDVRPHGLEWRRLMRECGVEPRSRMALDETVTRRAGLKIGEIRRR